MEPSAVHGSSGLRDRDHVRVAVEGCLAAIAETAGNDYAYRPEARRIARFPVDALPYEVREGDLDPELDSAPVRKESAPEEQPSGGGLGARVAVASRHRPL